MYRYNVFPTVAYIERDVELVYWGGRGDLLTD